MEKPFKFLLPSPNFGLKSKDAAKTKPHHFLTPSGMTLLPREKQPPPMYGKRGSTVPARFLLPVAQTEPLPDPVKQYCEPCELELHSLEEFRHHRAQHEKCPVDGCQYRGHPTVMDKHVTALHNSGLFDKFKKLSTPEEIAAWREERRKRYPTVENVLLKQKAQEQRQKRGERLETNKSRFGRNDDRKRALPNSESKIEDNGGDPKLINKTQGNRNKNKRKKRNNRDRKQDKPRAEANTQKPEGSCEEETTFHMFRGTLEMENYKRLDNKKKTPVGNALLGLAGMYGSDDETEEEDSEADREENDGEESPTHISNLCGNSSDKSPDVTTIKKDLKDIQKSEDKLKYSQEREPYQIPDDKAIPTNLNEDKDQILPDISKDMVTSEKNINELTVHNSLINDDNPELCLHEVPDQLNPKTESKSNISQSTITIKDNSSDEGPEETPIVRSIPEYKIKAEKLPSLSAQPEEPTQKRQTPNTKQTEKDVKAKQIVKRKSGLDYRKLKVRKQNTMLEKLLESDIRHERNVLLQCVRYVCENNFFGVGKSASTTTVEP